MPNFTILAPNGKKYKVSGPNREGAIEALNNKLNPKTDSSLGTALEFGKLNTYANTNDYVADLSEQFNNSAFANTLYDARNKIRGFFGAEPIDDATRDATTVAEQRKKVAELQKQRDALNYESLTSDSIKGPGSALYYGAQKVAESADGIAAALATGGTITPFLGAGEVNASLKEIENLDPEKRVKLATGGGLVIAALENLGLGMLFKGMTPEVVGAMGVKKINSILTAKGLAQLPVKVVSAMATEGVTEGLQEGVVIGADALGGKEFKDNEIFERLKEASIAGAGAGGTIRTGTAAVEGLGPQPFVDTEQSRAATAFARRIKKIAEDNNHNLNDVGVKSTNGAREVVTKAHTQMAEELRVLFSDLKPLVAVNDQDTLADLEDKILAEAGRKEGKNLAKSQVGAQELNALDRLAGEFYEGQKARNLLLEMNELTELHKSGYKGGVSKITDMANPLNNLTHPFSSQGGLTGLATTGAAYMAGGGTGLAIQGGAFAGGRAIDAVTGRRSTVNKYIRDNTKSDRMTQLSPIAPSLREQTIAEAQQAESAIEQQKMEEVALNRHLAKIGAPPKGDPNDPNPSPQYALENATGLNTAEVEVVLKQIEEVGGLPTLQRAIDSYRKSVSDGGKVTNLNELIRFIKRLKTPNAKLNAEPQLSPQGPESQSSTVNAKLDAEPQFGPRFTTQENYNRGIEANKKFNADQKTALNEVNNEGIMSESDYKTLSQAIDELDGNLGSKPLETFEAVYKKLENVDPKLVQEIIDPMYERITKQQRQRTVKTREGKTKEARVIKTIAEKQYRMSHRPNEDGAPISNMAQIFPDDIYSPNGIRYYGSAGVRGKADRESYDVIKRVKDNPEAEVTIYRAVPPGIKDINPGDWVSVSKTYAEDHAVFGYGPNGDQPGEIISQKVKASEIKSPGDDLNEYGYFPGIDKTVAQDPYEIEIQAAKDDYFSDPNNAEKRQNYLNLRSNRDNADGKTKEARVAPVPFGNAKMQSIFNVNNPAEGGNYIDLDSKQDLTGNTYQGGSIKIVNGKPTLETSDVQVEPGTKQDGGVKIKTNLFKQKAGWKWVDYDGPETIVSTEARGKHHYSLSNSFDVPVTLQTYPKQTSEPRLRPTSQGEIELGEQIGTILVRGKPHPVYDQVRVVSPVFNKFLQTGSDNIDIFRHVLNEDTEYAAHTVKAATRIADGKDATGIVDPATSEELTAVRDGIYNKTQTLLKDQPDEMIVYRIGETPSGEVKSFTTNPNYKATLNLPWVEGVGNLQAYTVKKSDILGSPDITSRGPIGENELIINVDSVTPTATPTAKTKQQKVMQPVQFGSTTDVALDTNLNNSFTMARDKVYNKGRDFKLDLQAKSLEAQEREGIDLSTLEDANIDRLADFAFTDALEALKDNQNAIGWYGRTVDQALKTVAELHPEVLTDPKAKMQFIWATAVTSNGLKVDKNFELALDVYETLKETGRFPTDAGIGQAAKGINFGLGQYHTMLDKFNRLSNSDDGAHALLADFMDSKFPLKQLEKEYDVKISGEGKDTLIRGAAILGPKIGGGFYSNLYGKFDELTMDRWLMRTVGRWRGGLVNINKPMIKKKTTEIKGMMKSYDLKPFKSLFYKAAIKPTKNMSNNKIEQLSQIIAKRSMDKEWRKQINAIPGGPELRKAGNALDKYLDGQVEAPAGPKERNFIRAVFAQTLDRLNDSPELKAISNEPITMSDLQALMWYPEKRLYDTAKQKDGESRGYKDDEAPDYANAARKAVANRLELSGQNGNGLRSSGRTGSPGGGSAPTNAGLPGATRQGILGQFFGGGQRNAAPKNNDRSQPVSEAEIRAQIPVVQAVFEIGKEGSEYENGIRDFGAILNLAKAYSIIPKLYRSFKDMEKADPTITEGALGAYNPNNRQAMAIMPGGVDAFGGTVSGLASLSYMTHEVAHGIAGSDIDTNQFMGDKFVFNYLTNQDDTAGINSLEAVFGDLVNTPNDARSQNKIIAEMLAVQKNLTFRDPDTGQVLPLRQTKSLMDSYNAGQRRAKANGVRSEQFNKDVKAFEKQIIDQRNYEQSIPELTVNALQVAMMHPKIMKKVAPNTYKLVKHLFDNSKNKSGIKFFNHSLAMAVAVILAMIARGEEPPEEQSLPPGALSPTPGILAA